MDYEPKPGETIARACVNDYGVAPEGWAKVRVDR